MLAQKYTITMHSFVDLITNSSTEIYIEASDKTIESIKALVDNILKLGGSTLKCDDLFTIEIDKQRFKKDYGYNENTGNYDEWIKEEYHDGYRRVSLLVKCRNTDSILGKQTAEVLSNLTGMFSIDANYDG